MHIQMPVQGVSPAQIQIDPCPHLLKGTKYLNSGYMGHGRPR